MTVPEFEGAASSSRHSGEAVRTDQAGRGCGRSAPLDLAEANAVAAMLRAFATPGRLLILSRLRQSPASISELTETVGMSYSSVTAWVRSLRHLGLIDRQREGRNVVYAIYDPHVVELLDEAVYQADHFRHFDDDPGFEGD
jgi:ArsR family transcriptional regulator, nickel/cobalt-responsive transcriptional repressor